MNDLTKDELEYIMHLWHVCNSNHSAPSQNFKNKIQSMIDNYCEHESDEYCYYPDGIKCTDFLTYACSESPCFLKCKKCKELYK